MTSCVKSVSREMVKVALEKGFGRLLIRTVVVASLLTTVAGFPVKSMGGLPRRGSAAAAEEFDNKDVDNGAAEQVRGPAETLQVVPLTEPDPATDNEQSTDIPPREARPVDDRPRGPIVAEESLESQYLAKFSNNAEVTVTFHEPEVLTNCWLQTMLSAKFKFSPQCNPDGSFAAKQCSSERCWCTNRDGSIQIKSPAERFFYGIRGMMLRCVQNGIPI